MSMSFRSSWRFALSALDSLAKTGLPSAQQTSWLQKRCATNTTLHTASVASSTRAADVHTYPAIAPVAESTGKKPAGEVLQLLDEMLDKSGDCLVDDAKAREDVVALFTQIDGEELLLQTGRHSQTPRGRRELLTSISSCFQSLNTAEKKHFTSQQSSNFLSTMTLLGLHDVRLTNAIVCSCRSELASAPPATIASLALALGTLGHTDHAFLHAMEVQLLRRGNDFDVQSLAKCLWMLGRLGYTNDNVASVVDNLTQRSLAPEATATDLVYTVWACAAHGDYNDALADRVATTMPASIHTLTGGELAKLATSLTEGDVRDGSLFTLIGQAATRGDLEAISPGDVAALVHALGTAQVTDTAIHRALGELVDCHLHRFSPNELDMVMAGYNRLGVHDALAARVAGKIGG